MWIKNSSEKFIVVGIQMSYPRMSENIFFLFFFQCCISVRLWSQSLHVINHVLAIRRCWWGHHIHFYTFSRKPSVQVYQKKRKVIFTLIISVWQVSLLVGRRYNCHISIHHYYYSENSTCSLLLSVLIRLKKRTYKLNARSFIITATSSMREVITDGCEETRRKKQLFQMKKKK
jgi:hypothetical protein